MPSNQPLRNTHACLLIRVCLLVCATLFTSTVFAENTPKIRVKDAPPPGFEDLVQEQTTEVDVFYGNKKVGSALATFTPDSLELSYPEEVTSLIPHLIDPAIITDALTGSLSTNAGSVCLSELQRECGIIEPNIAGVIFDESRFHLFVFINKLQLQQQGIVSNKFLPKINEPTFTSASSFSSSFSGEDGNDSYTTGANHIIAYGQSRLQSQWDYSNTRSFNLESLSLQNDNAGNAKEFGYYNSDTQFSSFTNSLDLVGARIFGSTRTRTDLDYAQATEIFLFLNSRSQVEVFRENKLIDGGIYETGNQQLNTLRLPSGSYPITLRVTDSSGSVSEEQYFFVKSSILAPIDQPLHYFEVGLLEKDNSTDDLPKLSDSELIRIGTAYRLKNNLGASIELLHSKQSDIIQGGVAYFGSGFVVQNNAMIGTDGEWGYQLLGQFRFKDISVNMDYRQVESGIDEFENDIEVRILPDDFSQGNISASIPLPKGTLITRAQYRNEIDEDSSTIYGLDYRFPLYHRNRLNVEANISTTFEEDDYNLLAGLRITKNKPQEFYSIRPRYSSSKNNGETEQGFVLFSNANKSFKNPTYGETVLGTFLADELDRSTFGLRTQNTSSLGKLDAQLEHVTDDERGSFLRYRGNQNTNLLTNNGKIAFGGENTTDSGVIIDLQGQAINQPFEIYVDGQPKAVAKVGKKTVLPLIAFKTYRISIRSVSDEILDFDEGSKYVTLYPGNVDTLNFEVSPITVLITRLNFPDGLPASRMRIDNAIGYAVTNEDGWLQAEISGNKPLEISKGGKPICIVELPELEIINGVAFVEELICEN